MRALDGDGRAPRLLYTSRCSGPAGVDAVGLHPWETWACFGLSTGRDELKRRPCYTCHYCSLFMQMGSDTISPNLTLIMNEIGGVICLFLLK